MHALLENILDQLAGAWRFRWLALGVAWTMSLLGWAGVMMLPDTYEASARVFVDARTTLSQVTQGIGVESNVDTQLQRVRQALLGGPQLERVATEAQLGVQSMTPQEKQALFGKLRDRIQLTATLSGTTDKPTGGLYVISYQDNNRDRALRVVDRLVNNFVDSTLGGKRASSEQAQKFLVDQIHEYEQRLSTAEQRRADFKKQNVGLMPGNQGGYFSRLQTEMEAVTRAQGLLAVAESRREALRRQLRGEAPVVPNNGGIASPGAVPAGTATAQNGGAQGNDTGTRLREAQARLDDLLLHYTDKHPDVIALRATITELQARQDKEIEAVRRGDPGALAGIGLSANPVFQNIQSQLNTAEVDIAALRGEIVSHQGTITELRRLLDVAPGVEAEFAKLDRDYDVTYAQYKALVERLERARISESAEETGIVRFEVIDPPSAAFSPVAPKRSMLIAAVLIFGLGAGAALAYLLHLIKPVFSSSRQLTNVTGLPVLGVVSMTWLDRHTARALRGTLAYGGVVLLLVMVCVGTLLAQNRILLLLHHPVS